MMPASSCEVPASLGQNSPSALLRVSPSRMVFPHVQGAYAAANLGVASYWRVEGVPSRSCSGQLGRTGKLRGLPQCAGHSCSNQLWRCSMQAAHLDATDGGLLV